MLFITTVCSYDFCKTVLVKKYTPCHGIIWLSLTNVTSFTLAFIWWFNYTIKAPLSLRTTWKNGQGSALKLLLGLMHPRPCEPEFWKYDLPANLFLLHVLPQTCNKVTPAFSYVTYKHTFLHVFQKLRHMRVSYISCYVLGSISLTSLPIFAQQ